MRSAFLLVGGFVALATGIAVLALDLPGRWVLGPGLVVVGIVLKLVGMLRDPQPSAASGGRTKTTLGTAPPAATAGRTARATRADLRRRGRTGGQTGQVSWR